MSSVTVLIVIVCEPNNNGFGSVGVKVLNNKERGGTLLNVGGGVEENC